MEALKDYLHPKNPPLVGSEPYSATPACRNILKWGKKQHVNVALLPTTLSAFNSSFNSTSPLPPYYYFKTVHTEEQGKTRNRKSRCKLILILTDSLNRTSCKGL